MKKVNFQRGAEFIIAIQFESDEKREAALKDMARYALLKQYVFSGHDAAFEGVTDLDELVRSIAEGQFTCKHLWTPLTRVRMAGEPVFEKCGFCGALREQK